MAVIRTEERAKAAVVTRHPPLWARIALPSVADLIFVAVLLAFTVGQGASGLLWDTSTGWHIRNGETILRTLTIPHVDSFSYTMAGQPWYAWEWLWDTVNAALHVHFALSGVVLFSALVLGLTFTLAYLTIVRRCGNSLIAIVLVLLALAASSIHMLARPHLVSWLLTLLVVRELEVVDGVSRRSFWTVPLIFACWTNLHGGFVMGLALIAIYAIAAILERDRALAKRFAGLFALSAAATALNPYGFKLHAHVVRFLASRTQMDRIDEFLSPNFHSFGARVFLLLVLISAATFMAARSVRWRDLLVAVLAISTALLAARNIPVSAMLLAFAMAPLLSDWLGNSRFQRVSRLGERMYEMERRLNLRFMPAAVVIVLTAGLLWGWRLPNAKWIPQRVPAAAADFLVHRLGAREGVFAPDYWSGYLVYTYAGEGFRVAVDDRSDFYGDARFRQYLDVVKARPDWQQVLDSWNVRYALVGADSSLRSVLSASPDWQEEYADSVAAVLSRRKLTGGTSAPANRPEGRP